MEVPQPDPLTDSHPDLTRVQMTLRLDAGTHDVMKGISERTGTSLNSIINKACRDAIAPPGGAARIARERRRLPRGPAGLQARAAAAYLMAYLGNARSAARMWPWPGRLPARPGDRDLLWRAGALCAAEFDTLQQEGRGTWATSAGSPSGA
jgi:hypothetical protein